MCRRDVMGVEGETESRGCYVGQKMFVVGLSRLEPRNPLSPPRWDLS